jgi:hypothetical protein
MLTVLVILTCWFVLPPTLWMFLKQLKHYIQQPQINPGENSVSVGARDLRAS